MSRLCMMICSFIVLFCQSAYAELVKVRITSVIDGDTIRIVDSSIQDTRRVRLYGIDAPEARQLHGKASTRLLQSMLSKTNNTYIEFFGKDKYGRDLGVVYYDDVDYNERHNANERMIKYGGAWVYDQFCSQKFCSDWKTLEEKAKKSRAGLWKGYDPIPPWEWREKNKK